MIVIGASALPCTRSGSGPGRASSSGVGSAKALEIEPSYTVAEEALHKLRMLLQ